MIYADHEKVLRIQAKIRETGRHCGYAEAEAIARDEAIEDMVNQAEYGDGPLEERIATLAALVRHLLKL